MKFKLLTAALMFAVAGVAAPASANVIITGIDYNPGTLNGTITYTPTSYTRDVGIGRFELTGTNQPSGTAVDLLTYCVDIFHSIHTGAFDVSPLSSLVSNVTKQGQLLALLTNGNPLIAAAGTKAAKQDIATAIQLAVWDILYETGSTNYSLSSGNFSANGAAISKAIQLADGYLGNITSGTWKPGQGYTAQVLTAKDNQAQIYLNAVPEPATWAMLIGGFGLAGIAMRRRRTSVRFATA